jgi:hypothetical protein
MLSFLLIGAIASRRVSSVLGEGNRVIAFVSGSAMKVTAFGDPFHGHSTMTGRVEIDDAYLGGVRLGGKRGRGATYKTPIAPAFKRTDDRTAKRLKLQVARGFRKAAIAK